MFGYIAYRAGDMSSARLISGVRFRAVYIADSESLRAKLSARAAARTLRRDGVRLAVFPPDCRYCDVFSQYGVTAPPLAPLYCASAAAIIRRYMVQCGIDPRRAAVTFTAESVTPELRRCVEALCAAVRYIALAVPQGGDTLAQMLRHNFGVAARLGALDTLPRADLVVDFDGSASDIDTLRLDESLSVIYDSELSNQLLALLWRAGALDASALRVNEIRYRSQSGQTRQPS